MYKGKSLIGIIPARSGSKGIVHKNIRLFAGKPLVAWAVISAIGAGLLDDIFVSTDSAEYAAIAEKYGASVPFLRPADLSDDFSPASGYIIHALKEYREKLHRSFDYFALLQPTTPLRTSAHIINGIKYAIDENLTSVVSFSPLNMDLRLIGTLSQDMALDAFAPICVKEIAPICVKEIAPICVKKTAAMMGENECEPERTLSHGNPNKTLRQGAKPAYRVNGMLYIGQCDAYEKTGSFYGPGGKAYVIDGEYAIDIDSEDDFAVAEFMAKRSGRFD
jgi:CMP-N-acetylneuraminic acid synthetase